MHCSFMEGFIADSDRFVPKDRSQNQYRHLGLRKDGILYLSKEEILYMYDHKAKDEYCVKTKAYFFVKNSCYNLLPTEGDEFLLYRRHKDFNRNKDKPLYPFVYVERDECIEDVTKRIPKGICCVVSDGVFTFLKNTEIEELSFETSDKLNKVSSQSDGDVKQLRCL